MSRFTTRFLELRTSGSFVSLTIILGWSLACLGYGKKSVTVELGVYISSKLSCRKVDISLRLLLI